MPQELRLWHVGDGDRLDAFTPTGLSLEQRLEQWLERDISILSDDLLVIGRQVETDFGGFVDLLCIDQNGDLVVVELKRDRTSRDAVAQVLDYASWAETLSNERIVRMADEYLAANGPLDEAFRSRFSRELPETLNQQQKMLLVASRIDVSTERIVAYLSENYGVDINAATFQYFRHPQTGSELLARSFLIDPSQVSYHAETRGSSKRARHLTFEELEGIAEDNGVAERYRTLVQGLREVFAHAPTTTRSTIRFMGSFENRKNVVVFSLVPGESDPERGVRFIVYFARFCQLFGLDETRALAILPEGREPYEYKEDRPELTGYAGYFRTDEEAQRFLEALRRTREERG